MAGRRSFCAQGKNYSEATAREIDEEILRILEEGRDLAARTLKDCDEQLHKLADLLLEEEEVPGEKVMQLFQGA